MTCFSAAMGLKIILWYEHCSPGTDDNVLVQNGYVTQDVLMTFTPDDSVSIESLDDF